MMDYKLRVLFCAIFVLLSLFESGKQLENDAFKVITSVDCVTQVAGIIQPYTSKASETKHGFYKGNIHVFVPRHAKRGGKVVLMNLFDIVDTSSERKKDIISGAIRSHIQLKEILLDAILHGN